MKIEPDGDPVAGSIFGINVNEDQPVQIEVYADAELVFQHDCPDPPCHEQFLIAPEFAGKTLKIASRSILSAEWTSIELGIRPFKRVL